MKTLELRKATGSLAGYVGDAQRGPVVFTVKGDPVAAIVPLTNVDLETISLASNRQFLRLIARSRASLMAKGPPQARMNLPCASNCTTDGAGTPDTGCGGSSNCGTIERGRESTQTLP